MPNVVDLLDKDLGSHERNPHNVIGTDPAPMLGKAAGFSADVLLQLPKLAIQAVIDALTGVGNLAQLALQFPGVAFDLLGDWLGEIPVIGPLVESIIGKVGDLLDLSNFFANVESLLGNLDFTDPAFDPTIAIKGFINTMLLPANLIAKLVNGLIPGIQIPGLDASKIVSGQFPQSMVSITSIGADIISGVLDISRIPGLTAAKIISGTLDVLRIPGLDADKIVSGLLGALRIPGLDASKIQTGTFAQIMIQGLPTLSTLLGLQRKSGTNLVHDAKLENNSQWPNTGATTGDWCGIFSTDVFRTAPQSRLITQPATPLNQNFVFNYDPIGGSHNFISTSPGEKFYVECWYYLPFANTGTTPTIRLLAGFIDSTGVTASSYPSITQITNASEGSWQRISGYVTVPNGYDRTYFAVQALGAGMNAGDKIYIDDPVVREVTESQNIVSALFGGVGSALTSLLAAVIPGLDASKIQSGSFSQSMISGLGSALGALLPRNLFRATSRSGANLIADPGLEDSSLDASRLAASQINTWSHDTTRKRSGSRSLKYVHPGGTVYPAMNFPPDYEGTFSSGDLSYFIPVRPGQKFWVSFWVWADAANTGTNKINGYLYCRDSTGVAPATAAAMGADQTIPTGQWVQMQGYVTIASGYDRMVPHLCSARPGANAGDQFWYDDVEVYEVTESQNIVQKLFGGVGSVATSILSAVIPGLDASKIQSGTFPQSMLTITSLAGSVINSVLGAAVIPALDASKIQSGTFAQTMVTGLSNFVNYVRGGQISGSNLVPDSGFTDANLWRNTVHQGDLSTEQKRSGTHSFKMTGASRTLYLTCNETGFVIFNTQPTEKFYCEAWVFPHASNGSTGSVQMGLQVRDSLGVNANQNVGGATASAASLTKGQWNKISGYVTIPAGYDRAWGYAISGTVGAGDVYYWDDVIIREVTESQNIVSRIFGGVGSVATSILGTIIPGLDASKITTGQFPQSMLNITSIASNLISGVLDTALIPLLDAAKIATGTLLAGLIPGLDASKIQTGSFPQAMISGLTGALGLLLPKTWFNLATGSGSNLIVDPDFTDAAVWPNTSNGTISSEQSYAGTTAWKMTVIDANYTGIALTRDAATQGGFLTVQPGEKFYAEAWVRGHSANTGTKQAFLQAAFTDSKGVNATTYGGSNFVTPTTTWQKLSGVFTVPTGYDRMQLQMWTQNNDVVGNIYYWDRPVLREETQGRNLVSALFGTVTSPLTSILATIIPGLDASKITGGSFAQSMVTGLSNFMSFVRGGQVAGSNLVTDPAITNNVIWSGAGIGSLATLTSEQKHSGTQAFKLQGPGSGSNVSIFYVRDETANINIETNPGERFYLEAWVYPHASNAGTVGSVTLSTACYDSTGVNAVQYVTAFSTAPTTLTKGQWQKISGYMTVPAGRDRISPYFQIANAPNTDYYYADDLVFREVTEAQGIVSRIFGAVGSTAASILTTVVPGLDASKITSGSFPQAMLNITSIAANIISGILGTGNIPGLDASKITTGSFAQSMITGLTNLSSFVFGGRSVGSNLITDPGFEDANEWPTSRTPGQQSTEQKRSGTTSRKVIANGSNQNLYANVDHRALDPQTEASRWKCQPGDKFYFEGWIYAPSTNTFGTGTMPRIGFTIMDSTGASAAQSPVVYAVPWATLQAAGNSWLKLSGYYTVPAGFDRIAPWLQIHGSDVSGNVYYWDDILIREVTESQNIVSRIFGSVGSVATSILTGVVPGLDASKITSGSFPQAMLNITSIAGSIITGTIAATVVPLLDAAKIATGTLLSALIPGLDASKITSGTFSQSMVNITAIGANLITGVLDALRIPTLGRNKILGSDISNLAQDGGFETSTDAISNVGGQISIATIADPQVGGTKVLQITSNANVVDAYMLPAPIDTRPAETWYLECYVRKTTTGSVGNVQLGVTSSKDATTATNGTAFNYGGPTLALSALTQNTWQKLTGIYTVPAGNNRLVIRPSVRQDVPAGQTIQFDDVVIRKATAAEALTGILSGTNIPGLDGSKITSGTIAQGFLNITSIAGSIITGTINSTVVPLLDAAKIATGTLLTALIPGLDASKITTGSFAQTMVTGLGTSLAALLPWNIFNSSAKSGSNLVIGPDFEDTTIGRSNYSTHGTAANYEYSTEQARAGTRSYKWTTLQQTWCGVRLSPTPQDAYFKVKEGETYRASVWIRSHASNTPGSSTVRLFMRWASTSGTPSGYEDTAANANGYTMTRTQTALASNGGWMELSCLGTAPAGRDRLEVMVLSDNTTAVGNAFYVDDAEVREVTDSQSVVSRIFGGLGNTLTSIISGVIPGLDASKVTSGSFATAQIPALDAGKITTGKFLRSLIGIQDFENLAAGSDFEGNHPWTLNSWTVATDQFKSGSKSAKRVGGAAGGNMALQGDFEVKEGDQIYAEFWARRDSAYNPTDAKLRFGNQSGTYISDVQAAPANLPVDTWTQRSGTFTVPAGATSLTITFPADHTAGSLWVDDIVIRRVKRASWIENLPGSKIVSSILASIVPPLDASKITTGSFSQAMVSGLTGALSAVNASVQGFKDRLTGFVNSTDTQIDNWVLGLLTGSSALKAGNLVGSPPTRFFDLIPLSSIGTAQANLLDNPTFDNAQSISAMAGWTWDSTVKHSATGGSAKATATGARLELASNSIKVVEKQEINLSIFTRWSGLTTSGTPIKLVVQELLEGQIVGTKELDVIPSPLGASTPDWVELEGLYKVPDVSTVGGGVDAIRMVLVVDSSATAGSVWFSDGSITKQITGGIAPISWITGLPNALEAANEFVQMLIQIFMKALTGLPFVGWLFGDLEEEIGSWFEDTQETAGRADDAWGWVKDTWDRITQGWNNDSESGRGLTDVFDILRGARRQQDELAAGLAALQVDKSGNSASGKSVEIDFRNYSGVPPMFTKFYDAGSGNVDQNPDGELFFTNNTGMELYAYNGDPLLTDYQEVSLVVTRQTIDYIGGYNDRSIYFLLRMNAARTEGLIARLRGRTIRIGYVKAGVNGWGNPTWLTNAAGNSNEVSLSVGSYMTFRVGTTQGQPRQLQFLVNNLVKSTWNDPTAVSMMDANHRLWGWGLEHSVNDALNRSAFLAVILANDNYPPSIPGTYATINRTLTAQIGCTSGTNLFPTGFFNNIAEQSPNIEIDLSAGSFKVSDAGIYEIIHRHKAGTSSPNHMEFVLYVNGVPYRYGGGDHMFGSNALGGTILGESRSAYWKIPLPAGAIVQLGYRTDGGTVNVFRSDAAGMETYLSIMGG